MKTLAVLVLLSAALALTSAGNVVCYFVSWTIYRTGDGQFAAKNIDPTLCTHILYSYIGLNVDGTVHVLDDWDITGLQEIDHLISLKEQNPDLKIGVSMGGWTEGSATYSQVAADPDLRAVLAKDIVSFLDMYKFDGFDLWWEWPGQREDSDPLRDPLNFITLLGELREAINAAGYIFSATVNGQRWAVDTSYPDAKSVSDNVDMLNVMTFDYHGDWETRTGQNAPLYQSHLDVSDGDKALNVDAGIQHWIDKGADPSKMHIGIATYGRSFTLVNSMENELYAPANGTGELGPYTAEDGMVGYNEICAFDSDWEETWDDEQMVPYIVNGDQWIGYDNVKSVQLKIQYANEKKLGGAMVWSLDTDDFLGLCGDPFPLLHAVNDNLN